MAVLHCLYVNSQQFSGLHCYLLSICEFHQTAVMTLRRSVHVEEKTAEPASDYDAAVNFIMNSSLSKSQIGNNEQDVLE
jgi:hypothetical protein